MTDLASSTVAFYDIMSRNPGDKKVYDFLSEKEADSFRTAIYATRRKMRDNTVLISINGKTVTLTKASNAVKVTLITSDGVKSDVTNESQETDYKKKIDEIIADSEDIDEALRADYIKDAITHLNSRRA